jgi:hypothetical protein
MARHPYVPRSGRNVAQIRRDVACNARGIRGKPIASVAILPLQAGSVRPGPSPRIFFILIYIPL